VVGRLRGHASLALWSGDNEIDYFWASGSFGTGHPMDPNRNVLTRQVLPAVLDDLDGSRPYLPSSPYVSPAAFHAGLTCLPEDHLWGPRNYFKSTYYTGSACHFASEIGYHGCPSAESVRKFISPEKVWPWMDNDEWRLHASDPVPGVTNWGFRIEDMMVNQVRELFGRVPDTLERFVLASQISQAEAKKFFVELFRANRWRRTGILWWNLLDGWPQFSDAVVDYYFDKKLAYHYLKASQSPICLMLREPVGKQQSLVGVNDTRQPAAVTYSVTDVAGGQRLLEGGADLPANGLVELGRLRFLHSTKGLLRIDWKGPAGEGRNHYLQGLPPMDLDEYVDWMRQARLYPEYKW